MRWQCFAPGTRSLMPPLGIAKLPKTRPPVGRMIDTIDVKPGRNRHEIELRTDMENSFPRLS